MKSRQTSRKTVILEFLENQEQDHAECGWPPYSATTIAKEVEGSPGKYDSREASPQVVQSVARTLRGMVREGLLVAVCDRQYVRNAIADDMIEMPVTAYYSARTMEHDKQRTQEWEAGAEERMERGLVAFGAVIAHKHGLPPPSLAQPALPAPAEPPRVIDMGAAEIVGPDGEWQPF